MALPEIRAVGTFDGGSGAAVPGLPTGTEAGDLLLMWLETRGTDGEPSATGWAMVEVEGVKATQVKGNTRLSILWKKAVGSDATTTGDTGDHQIARIIGIKKGTWNESTPFHKMSKGEQASTKSVSVAGLTTSIADCLIFPAASGHLPDEVSTAEFGAATNASLGSLTERIDTVDSAGDGGAIWVVSGTKASAGEVSATTCTAVTSAERGTICLAVAPVASGKTVEFAAAITSSSSVSASITPIRLFAAAISSTSALSASLVRTRFFQAAISSTSAISAALELVGEEPQPFDPNYRPPLELDVEVETAEGAIFRLSADDLKASNVPTGITFTTQRGDGFGTASFTLARSILKDYPDLSLLDTVRFVGRQGDVAYEGRIHSFPRTNDPMHQINVSCVGWMTYLKSRPCAPLIIDRRLSGWVEPSTQRQANLATASPPQYLAGTSQTASQNAGEAGPGVVQSFNRLATVAATYSNTTELWFYAGGEKIGLIRYRGSKVVGITEGAETWQTFAFLSDDDLATTADIGINHHGATVSDIALSATGDRYYVGVVLNYSGTSTLDGEWTYLWSYPRIVGDHGLTTRGTEPEEGYYVTDIGKYVAQTYYPKIDVSEVQDNTFTLTQATWHDSPSDGYAIWQQLNDLVLWELNMWEDRKLHFHPSDLSTYDWVLRTDDPGVSINWQGDSIENFANGVPVTYSDFFGHTYTLWPDEHAELRDDSEDNPASRHGENLWAPIQTVPWQCLQPEALQYGRVWLAEHNRPRRPGSYRIAGGYLRDGAGHWRQGWQVRNSDTLGILDHPQDFPRIITATSWTQDGTALDVTVDGLPQTLQAITARHELALQARNLG